MGIGGGVDVAMVKQVMGLPPARAHLARRGRNGGPNPDHLAPRPENGVGDQPVIDGGDGQHAHQVEGQGQQGHAETQAGPKQHEAAQVAGHDQNGTKGVQDTPKRGDQSHSHRTSTLCGSGSLRRIRV